MIKKQTNTTLKDYIMTEECERPLSENYNPTKSPQLRQLLGQKDHIAVQVKLNGDSYNATGKKRALDSQKAILISPKNVSSLGRGITSQILQFQKQETDS